MKKRVCENCNHWTPKPDSDIFGTCELARKGPFLHKPWWCKEGYTANHSTARYKRQTACKLRYSEKEGSDEQISDDTVSRTEGDMPELLRHDDRK